LGGEVEGTLVFPFGLYAKPKPKENVILYDKGHLIIPITDDKKVMVQLEYGDVIYQDGKSFIHLIHKDGNLHIKTNELKIDCASFVVNAKEKIDLNSPPSTLKHNQINVGDTHKHTTVAIEQPTTPPIG